MRRFFEALGQARDEPDERAETWNRLTSEDVVYVEDPRCRAATPRGSGGGEGVLGGVRRNAWRGDHNFAA